MSDAPDSEARLKHWLREHLARQLAVPAATITFDRTLAEYGLDSVDAILIAGELEEAFAVEIDPATFIQYASFETMIVALAAVLDARG